VVAKWSMGKSTSGTFGEASCAIAGARANASGRTRKQADKFISTYSYDSGRARERRMRGLRFQERARESAIASPIRGSLLKFLLSNISSINHSRMAIGIVETPILPDETQALEADVQATSQIAGRVRL
jgi:hypothetical protein